MGRCQCHSAGPGTLEAARRLGDRVQATVFMDIHRARADLFFAVGDFDRSRTEAEVLVEITRRVQDRLAEANALVQVAKDSLPADTSAPAVQAEAAPAPKAAKKAPAKKPAAKKADAEAAK